MDNGGPAFPETRYGGHSNRHPVDQEPGMTLRDWFAGQALASGKARETLPDYDLDALFGRLRTGIRREEILAAEAYRIADAMLAERSK